MAAHSEQSVVNLSNAVWYLGIDFGTSGVSAILLNQSRFQRYPIYWSQDLEITDQELPTVNPQSTSDVSGKRIFRLPAVAYSAPGASQLFRRELVVPITVGSWASSLASQQPGIFLQNFKPYLNIGVPYYCPNRHEWEPTLLLSGEQRVSLYWVRRTFQAILATLQPNGAKNSGMEVGAVGMDSQILVVALKKLQGVILGCPAAWGDTYRFNLREAVLEANLVRHPEQIFFLEDAIATILASLPVYQSGVRSHNSQFSTQNFPHGGTLVINAGATTTEIAVVNLPDDWQELTHSDFRLYSLLYAGNAVNQDIFCQLLYPQMSLAQLEQLSFPSDVELPLPGQPDRQKRDRLALLLQGSSFGQALLKATEYLKLILPHKEEFTWELGTDCWQVLRLDLETKVILPFIEYLNQVVNALLIETGLSDQVIYQVFCVGGTASLGKFPDWIQKKFPNATVIQDADSPTGNWVAAGLANLPLYPQVLNHSQQQYSDYFLLLELLRAFSPETAVQSLDNSYKIEEIIQKLERRGLNTGTCYERIVSLVKGQLPAGLLPSIDDASWISQASKQNQYYSMFAEISQIFALEENQLYRPNIQDQELLRLYMNIILSGAYQKFAEPMIVRFNIG